MTEGLLWWQWIIGAAMFFVLAASAFVLVLSLFRFSSQLSEEERFERQQRRQRDRLHSVAPKEQYGPGPDGITRLPVTNDGPPQSPFVKGPEDGTVRADLAAFAALLVCMVLVGAAIWAASGW